MTAKVRRRDQEMLMADGLTSEPHGRMCGAPVHKGPVGHLSPALGQAGASTL